MKLENFVKEIKKDNVAKNTAHKPPSKITSSIRSDTLQGIKILIQNFLKDVTKQNNPIRINDTKELKDVITVFQELETLSDDTQKQTPAISTDAINFISNNTKEPHDSTGAMNGTNDKVKKLDTKDVNKLINNEEKSLNNKNVSKM